MKSKSDQKQKSFTNKQLLFVEFYLQNLNARQAVKKAGYTSKSDRNLSSTAYYLLQLPHIKTKIRERLDEIKGQTPKALQLIEQRLQQGKSAINLSVKKGFVYFAKADNGLIKIGRSHCVEFRLHRVSKSLPYDLELMRKIESEDCVALERGFHKKFSGKRIRGEWFALDESDIESVSEAE